MKEKKRNKMFSLETKKLKLIPLDNYNLPSHRVLEKVGMEKYEKNKKCFGGE
ncbi:hypothetical protein ES703_89472 [subsurface metagenome]